MPIRSLGAALATLFVAAAAGTGTVDEIPSGSVYTVAAIRVERNVALSDRAIRDVMLTKAARWYEPWQRRDTFDPALFRTDLARVQTLLRESGY
jgi:outer membrane protein assembly factor BamA